MVLILKKLCHLLQYQQIYYIISHEEFNVYANIKYSKGKTGIGLTLLALGFGHGGLPFPGPLKHIIISVKKHSCNSDRVY